MESLIPRSVIIALTEMNVHNMNLTWKIQSLQDEKAIKLELTWTARENQAKDRVNRQMKKDSATKGQVRVSEQNGYGDVSSEEEKDAYKKIPQVQQSKSYFSVSKQKPAELKEGRHLSNGINGGYTIQKVESFSTPQLSRRQVESYSTPQITRREVKTYSLTPQLSRKNRSEHAQRPAFARSKSFTKMNRNSFTPSIKESQENHCWVRCRGLINFDERINIEIPFSSILHKVNTKLGFLHSDKRVTMNNCSQISINAEDQFIPSHMYDVPLSDLGVTAGGIVELFFKDRR